MPQFRTGKIGPEPARQTCVYLARCGEHVKVGVAHDPVQRMRELNTGTPVEAVLVFERWFATRKIARSIEGRMHRRLQRHHARGEWFKIDLETARAALEALPEPTAADLARQDWCGPSIDEVREAMEMMSSPSPPSPPQ